MPFARVNNIDLFFESHGTGPAIVFLHGRGGNHLSWWQQVPHFQARFRCIAIDHREFGLSREQPDGPGRKAFAEDLRQLLDHLKIERACLVGQSMGGFTAMDFAIRNPQRVAGVVLADTTGGITAPDVLEAMRANVAKLPEEPTARSLALDFPQREPALAFLYSALGRLTLSIRESLKDLLLNEDGPTLEDLTAWNAHKVPVQVIVGAKDVMIPPEIARRVAAHLPGAKLAVIGDAGHSAYFEKPAEFNAVLDAFLATLRY